MKKRFGLIVVLAQVLFFISSCSQAVAPRLGGTIEVAVFDEKLNSTPQHQLVDVRSPEEYSEGHLKDAVNINWNGSNFETEINKLDKNKPVFVYCRSGKRSSSAMQKMTSLGFKEVYNLNGGIQQWEDAGKPVE